MMSTAPVLYGATSEAEATSQHLAAGRVPTSLPRILLYPERISLPLLVNPRAFVYLYHSYPASISILLLVETVAATILATCDG